MRYWPDLCAVKISRAHLVTFAMVALAAVATIILYWRYSTRPWTRDAQVRANVVGIAARVAGPIIQIPIRDNQAVKKGDLLFEIDPSTFQATVNNAEAKLKQAQAAEVQAQQEFARQNVLYETKTNDLRDVQNAQDSYVAAVANTAAAQANLDTAKLNLDYTKVFAPVDGYLTNVNTSPGTYVNEGEQLLALVDSSSFWIAAYFKETQLRHIRDGASARITLMGHDFEPFRREGCEHGLGNLFAGRLDGRPSAFCQPNNRLGATPKPLSRPDSCDRNAPSAFADRTDRFRHHTG